MNLELITLTGVILNSRIYQATISTADGEIGVFPDHESLVTVAAPGVITVRHNKEDDDSKLEYFAIGGGVVEISPGTVRVLVDEAEHGADIIEAESKAALERAMALRDEAADHVELEKAHQMIDRHQVRLKVAELRRRKRR